jgi:hypothetical protein
LPVGLELTAPERADARVVNEVLRSVGGDPIDDAELRPIRGEPGFGDVLVMTGTGLLWFEGRSIPLVVFATGPGDHPAFHDLTVEGFAARGAADGFPVCGPWYRFVPDVLDDPAADDFRETMERTAHVAVARAAGRRFLIRPEAGAFVGEELVAMLGDAPLHGPELVLAEELVRDLTPSMRELEDLAVLTPRVARESRDQRGEVVDLSRWRGGARD